MKTCRMCGQVKPTEEFAKDNRRPDGRGSYCYDCKKKRNKESEARHPEATTARDRRYYERNKERLLARDRASTRKKEYMKGYYTANEAQKKEYARNYYENNAERVRDRSRNWAKNNMDKVRAILRNRKARVRGNGGRHTAQQWRDLCDYYGNVCLACGASGPLTVDHIIPVSKGGTNNIDNIQPLCPTCNRRKSASDTDYRPDRGEHVRSGFD